MPEKTKTMRYAEGEKDGTLQHYDLEPAIFELFLDPYMKYTCGLYPSEMSRWLRRRFEK